MNKGRKITKKYEILVALLLVTLVRWVWPLPEGWASGTVDKEESRKKIIEQYIDETEKSLKKPGSQEAQKASVKQEIRSDTLEPDVISDKKKEKAPRLKAPVQELPVYPPIVYKLDVDDVLDIAVWRHPELSTEVIVRPDGKISFPLVGELRAKGLTAQQLVALITKKLIDFGKKRALKPKKEKEEYLISSGDVLDISVWKVADLSRDVIVRPDGMISFPLIGNVETAGRTLTQLDDELTEKLKAYVKDPQVSVMIREFGSKTEVLEDVFLNERPEVSVVIKKIGGKKIIVMGDVKTPGVLKFTAPITIAEAISLAGDFTRYAVRNNVVVIRGDIRNKPEIIFADLIKLYKEGDLSQNIILQPQDIIFVPRTFVGNVSDFIYLIAPILDTVYRSQVIGT
ncbi:MAG TPA: polysaccharide biosynthesis/export family protein, partial [Candidatus Omnitrophota bacterium]|nr:polysaccharide biosynthesis/export family protein [Candidatus Omnitrophota bacterium]